jgi:tetratricopeptide (TPR) repeat protein
MQNMSRENLLDTVELNRLGPSDTGKIITSALGKTSFGDTLLNKIYKETGGTPFFILEVLKLLMEDGSISETDGVWELRTELDDLDIPTKVYDVVKRRLDRLIKEQRRILDCASVVGEEFRSDLVGKAIGIDKLQLLENLSEIEKSHKLIRSIEKKYVFDHAKIREVLYKGIMNELKQEYHRIVGDTLAEIHKENPSEIINELAYHYLEAGDERAGGYLVKAGDIAKAEYANEESIRYYKEALAGGFSDAGIFEKLGDVQVINGEYEAAMESFSKAKELTSDNKVKARSLGKMGSIHSRKGAPEKCLEMLAEAKPLVKEGTEEHGRIVLAEGHSHFWLRDLDRAMDIFRQAVNDPAKMGIGESDVGKVLRSIGNIHHLRGERDNSLEYYKKSLELCESIGDDYGIAAALNNIGTINYERSDLNAALEYFEKTMETVQKLGDQQGLSMSTLNIGNVYFSTGDLDKAMEYYERTYAIRQKLGNLANTAGGLLSIGLVHLEKGEYEKALADLERSMNELTEAGDEPMAVYAQPYVAEAHLALGHREEAVRNAQESIERAGALGHKPFEGIGRRSLGIIYRETDKGDRAMEEFDKAIVLFEESGAISELARIRYEKGLLLRAQGDKAAAKKLFETARTEFERQGMKLWAEKCAKALGELTEGS